VKLDYINSENNVLIRGYGEGWIKFGDQTLSSSCALSQRGILTSNLPTIENLKTDNIIGLVDKETDIALLGTGATQVFPDYELTTSLGQLGIALEVMDTGAACRCYNILISEGRALVALLYMIGH
tara:strand:+ start:138 stop:512 length:375 start_codon:yes stop_codon:yes gene_type:complete